MFDQIVKKNNTYVIPRFRVCYRIERNCKYPFILVFLTESSHNGVDFPDFNCQTMKHDASKCFMYAGESYQLEELDHVASCGVWVTIAEIINKRSYLRRKIDAQVVQIVIALKMHLFQNPIDGSIVPCPDIGYVYVDDKPTRSTKLAALYDEFAHTHKDCLDMLSVDIKGQLKIPTNPEALQFLYNNGPIKQNGQAGLGYYFETDYDDTQACVRFAIFDVPSKVWSENMIDNIEDVYLLSDGSIVLRNTTQFMTLNIC